MTSLKPVKCGWKWLETTINRMIDAINQRTVSVPVGGGLDIQESQTGVLISATSLLQARGVSGSTGGGPTPDPNGNPCGWQLVVTIDANCTPWNQYVWGGPPFAPGTTTPNP